MTKKNYCPEYWSYISDDWSCAIPPQEHNDEGRATRKEAMRDLENYAAKYPVHQMNIPTRITVTTTRFEILKGLK